MRDLSINLEKIKRKFYTHLENKEKNIDKDKKKSETLSKLNL
jgi:hypothetical protein